MRTRRYHALLLTAATPPTGRCVLVNGIEAWAETPAGRFALTSQLYASGTLYPDGAQHIAAFAVTPWPSWRFVLPDGTTVWHEVFVARATQETVLRWRSDRPVRLTVRLLLSGRDYHALHHENPAFAFTTHREGGGLAWRPYPGVPAITARGNFTWTDAPDWYRSFLYTAEQERGLDAVEDLATPGMFTWDIGTMDATLILRANGTGQQPAEDLAAAERSRRNAAPLAVATDAYLAGRGTGQTILAGFPWFTDWGRDTFIAMRGLLIGAGRLREAAAILLAWADHVSDGMLPNRFPDGSGPPEYNAVDASLWFIVAVHELIQAGGVTAAEAGHLQRAGLAIVQGYTGGTRYGIAQDAEDGLLLAGVPGVQLTWMDAKVGDWVVTPRIGKPVEVQALWVNALTIAGHWPDGERWAAAGQRARASVLARFPDPATGGLIDVLDVNGVPGATDRQVRPNQVLAAGGLPVPVLTLPLVEGVVALAERMLLTPLGLRTLAPDDPAYQGRYTGGPRERDGAYHQGTVWPWLLGPFVAAWLATRGGTAEARAEGRARFLPPLHAHLQTAGLGHMSEVADGDAPHTPGGCPFQAWSLGALLQVEAMLAPTPSNLGDAHAA